VDEIMSQASQEQEHNSPQVKTVHHIPKQPPINVSKKTPVYQVKKKPDVELQKPEET
jgi:hypothetical protein